MAMSLREDVAETLALMEIVFPPSFFVIMSHLPLYLVEELIILGSVHVRWMYLVERMLGSLNFFVRNKSRPEAFIARGYLMEETIGFIASYMEGYEAVRGRVWDAEPDNKDEYKVLEGVPSELELTPKQRDDAHLYVLRNNTPMQPYCQKWENEYSATNGACGKAPEWIERTAREETLDINDVNKGDTRLLSSLPSQ